MTTGEESSLIRALRKRDRSAWSAVVDRHLGEVYGFVFHLVGGDHTLAEELNQEVWVESLDHIDRCDETRGTFRSWLFGIARRRVALYYRRRAMSAGVVSPCDRIEDVADPESTSLLPADVLEQVERKAAVRAAMLVLSEDRRQVLVGKYIEGLSVEALATQLGKTSKAVESLLSRARQQMRNLLGGYMMPFDAEPEAIKGPSHDQSTES